MAKDAVFPPHARAPGLGLVIIMLFSLGFAGACRSLWRRSGLVASPLKTLTTGSRLRAKRSPLLNLARARRRVLARRPGTSRRSWPKNAGRAALFNGCEACSDPQRRSVRGQRAKETLSSLRSREQRHLHRLFSF